MLPSARCCLPFGLRDIFARSLWSLAAKLLVSPMFIMHVPLLLHLWASSLLLGCCADTIRRNGTRIGSWTSKTRLHYRNSVVFSSAYPCLWRSLTSVTLIDLNPMVGHDVLDVVFRSINSPFCLISHFILVISTCHDNSVCALLNCACLLAIRSRIVIALVSTCQFESFRRLHGLFYGSF